MQDVKMPLQLEALIRLATTKAPPDLPEVAVRHACLDYWYGQNCRDIYRNELANIFELARRQEPPKARTIHKSPAQSDLRHTIRLGELCDWFEAGIDKFRFSIGRPPVSEAISSNDTHIQGGRRAKPFTSREACSWLAKQIELDDRAIYRDVRSRDFRVCFRKMSSMLSQIMPTAPSFGPNWRTLVVHTEKVKGEWRICAPDDRRPAAPMRYSTRICDCAEGSALDRLAMLTALIQGRTPFDGSFIVWWVLTGVRPELPAIRVVEQVRMIGDRPFSWIESQVFAPSVTFKEYLAAYRSFRRKWSQTARQPVNRKHAAIVNLVKKQGPPPSRFASKYWQQVRRAVIRELGVPDFQSWRACAQAYWRIKDRLSAGDT
jgi:hypothetical protein